MERQGGVADAEVPAAVFKLESSVLVECQLFEFHGNVISDQLEIFGLDVQVGEFEEGVVNVRSACGVEYRPDVVVDEHEPPVGDFNRVGGEHEPLLGLIRLEDGSPLGDVDGVLALVGAQHHVQVFELHIAEAKSEGLGLDAAQPSLHGAGIEHVLAVVILDGHLPGHELEGGGDPHLADGNLRAPSLAQGLRNLVNYKGLDGGYKQQPHQQQVEGEEHPDDPRRDLESFFNAAFTHFIQCIF